MKKLNLKVQTALQEAGYTDVFETRKVFDWFRKQHKIHVSITPIKIYEVQYQFTIHDLNDKPNRIVKGRFSSFNKYKDDHDDDCYDGCWDTIKEVEIAAIHYLTASLTKVLGSHDQEFIRINGYYEEYGKVHS